MLDGTVPPESEEASNRGMFVRAGEDGLSVISLDEVVLSLSAEQVSQLNDDDVLTINAVEDGTTVSVGDFRSEERRVGKEWRCGRWPYQWTEKRERMCRRAE